MFVSMRLLDVGVIVFVCEVCCCCYSVMLIISSRIMLIVWWIILLFVNVRKVKFMKSFVMMVGVRCSSVG